ncbi:hypothetical protein FTV88_0305 [Heliorestis convoluta]|uniref:Uncharacterized protein n=1 Tax=Heliorestis convoluta TaxID=356322 RepID=A0A5Q2MVZ5_9FIRM|nr:hypothetical protein FTV88_0305 [Heliorestis convoluta]
MLAVTAWDQSRAEESVMTGPLYEVTPTQSEKANFHQIG